MSFKKVDPKMNFPLLEEGVLEFWKKNKIFEKSVEERPKNNQFSFYDGPPYATNTPHFGNILAGLIKDVIPRYKTMQGYRVERVWGWDTHGLPIENIVEKKLGFKSRDEIYDYGVDKFNEKCRSQVFEYVESWRDIIDRTGRWADMDNPYITMDKNYMESVWWVFSELWNKDLVYEGHKVMPYCPRCSTGLSSFEVGSGGYIDKTDKAVTIKFELEDEKDTYFLAWTTTPWTLPGNLALTVGEGIDYLKIKSNDNQYILAEERVKDYSKELGKYKIIEKIKGKELVGKSYKPIFDYYEKSQKAQIPKQVRDDSMSVQDEGVADRENDNKKSFIVISGDFVTTEDGTGIVHTAPAFGEDDSIVGQKFGIDFFMPVDELGKFTGEVPEYKGMSVIDSKTNSKIIEDLGEKVVKVDDYTHPYPHCWRCESPLIFRAIDSWFVSIDKIREDILKANKSVKWVPEHVGSGRYAKMVESAPDWNISRNRFWGVPLPVWKCECGERRVYGNIADLEKDSGKKIDDIHLHKIQDIKVNCRCGKKAKLTGEILDVWFDSGSMPYGKLHYPFENKDQFQREFPTNFIAEGIDQTRGWFRSLMVIGTALFNKSPFNNVVVNGIILAEDGSKMSKSKHNFTDPMVLMNKYGADAMRFYLMASPAVKAEDMRFVDSGVDEVLKKVILRLWNSYSFFMMYASLDSFSPTGKLNSENLLDRWMLSKLNILTDDVTKALDSYDISLGARYLSEFVDELSNWYIRRSRKRFWKSDDDSDKMAAYETLYYSLVTYIKLLAPYMPFVTEEIYQGLVVSQDKSAPMSIHLSGWPKVDSKKIDNVLDEEMSLTRRIVEMGLSERNSVGIKVRQPLGKLSVVLPKGKLHDDLKNIISEEVNIKSLDIKSGSELKIDLDVKITKELKEEGLARDFIRFIQDGRKKAGFNVEDRIITTWDAGIEEFELALSTYSEIIAKETLSVEFKKGKVADCGSDYSETIKLDGKELAFSLKKT
ncbi:MAG: isoleucine--tRNA ligase [Patescibacteria group bacterium]|nr:isoleucine--tRNA ligase [Patescibacteria group bacterium]